MLIQQGSIFVAAAAGDLDVLVHGCNCYHTMGAGVARLVKEKYPFAFVVDKKTSFANTNKLGTLSIAKVGSLVIANAYTQFDYRGEKNVDYDAIRACMKNVKLLFSGKRIGMPKIGAGLAGGQWTLVADIVREELADELVTVYYL